MFQIRASFYTTGQIISMDGSWREKQNQAITMKKVI